MFFALAQAMSLEEYGRFAFAFSLALVLAKAAALGQPQLMLRLLPGYADAGEKWHAAMRFGLRNVGVGGFLAALAMVLVGLFQGSGGYLFAAAPLCLLLAFSELQSSILRTCEKIVWALAPREIVWRSSLILLGLGVWLSPVSGLTAATLFAFASLSLALVLFWQSYADHATRYRTSLDGDRAEVAPEWWPTSRRFWITNLVIFGTPNLSVVVVGAVIDVSESGPFFAALKTAQLMQLVLMAANIVAMPMISKYHAAGDTSSIETICGIVSTAAGAVAIFGLFVLVTFGAPILTLFGEGFEAAHTEMVILAIGFAVSGMNGPNGPLLDMTGHERTFNRIILVCNGIGLASLAPAVQFGGSTGASIVVAGSMILWNVWAWLACRRLAGIDPSIFGVIKRARRK
ncbi:MAG: lipopolysaccharide biosynthesis protein [Pseudomonadota bacterium]